MSSLDNLQQKARQTKVVSRERRLGLPSLSLRVSERKLLLTAIDVLLLSLSLMAAVRLRTELVMDFTAIFLNLKWFVTLIVVWAIMAVIFDVYNLARAASPNHIFWAITGAVGFTSIVYVAIPWLTPPLENRSYIFVFFVLAIVSIGTWRLLYALLFIQPAFQRRALVVGAGNSANDLVKALRRANIQRGENPFLGTGHEIVGLVDDDPAKLDTQLEEITVLGDSGQLVELVLNLEIDELVIAITHTEGICPQLYEAILDCREMGTPIVTMPTIYERLTRRVAVEHASRNIETAAGQQEGAFFRMYGMSKRVVDVVGAVVGLIILFFFLPFVALSNALTSPGPLFFRQQRVGLGGRLFEVIKFRSMVPEAEQESGAVWASESDDRVTSAGRWMRLSHLDELPQVINVLKGEMSLVGPRPERPEFVEYLSKTIPFYRVRNSVRPGITGWAQIHVDYGDSVEDAQEKLEYDLYYLKRAGPRIDTVILLRTISKVLSFRGR